MFQKLFALKLQTFFSTPVFLSSKKKAKKKKMFKKWGYKLKCIKDVEIFFEYKTFDNRILPWDFVKKKTNKKRR